MLAANDYATGIYHSLLLKSKEALEYLESRGLKKEVLISSSVGFADNNISVVSLLKAKGLEYEHLATLDGKDDYFKNRIILPLISLGHTRLFTSRGMPGKIPVHLHQRGKIEHFYNEDVLFGAKYVLIVESPICCLTLKQNGINAIARLGNRNGDIDKISKSTDIYIVPDIDGHRAGEEEAIRLGAILRSLQYKNIKLVYLSDDYTAKTDVNSFFMKNNVDALRSLVKSAVDIDNHRETKINFKDELRKIESKKLKNTSEYDLGSDLSFAKYLDIVPEIRRYTDVVEYGSLYKCICPFHSDTTPSLTIYPKSKSWFCFSCNIGGDILEFVRRIEEVDFKEALNIIVKRNKNENNK